MNEIIEQINEIDNDGGYDGYEVATNKQKILLVIANFSKCCEQWGYFWCNDNTEEFVGSVLSDVKVVDTALNEQTYKDNSEGGVYEGCVMFVNLETSKGTLQFVAYNDHNGYYGHTAKVIAENFNYEAYL
jgi:hypothetical protein